MASRKHIEFSPGADFCIFAALALLILPLRWLYAAAVAAVFHECCHYLALGLCGVRVFGITIGSGGVVMETEPMTDAQELFCALAGPCGSFLLLLFIRVFPELGICAGIQGLYNLLPLFPLDGGRALRSLLGLICPGRRDQLSDWIRKGMLLCILIAALTAVFHFRLGFGVLPAACFLLRKAAVRKIPCKAGPEGVQ